MSKPILDHKHGTNNGRCGHPDCVAAQTRYAKRWRYERAHGRKRLVDAAPVVERIKELREHEWSVRSIGGEADVPASVVSRLALGRQSRVSRKVHDRIMALDPTGLPSTACGDAEQPMVNKAATVRKIQGLLRLGWRHEDLAAHGVPRTGVILSQKGQWVYRSTHDAVDKVFRELCMTPGPSERTRRRAIRLGYAAPLSWDNIDDPAEQPAAQGRDRLDHDEVDEAKVLRVLGGERLSTTKAEKEEIMRRWVLGGGSKRAICERMGWQQGRYGKGLIAPQGPVCKGFCDHETCQVLRRAEAKRREREALSAA